MRSHTCSNIHTLPVCVCVRTCNCTSEHTHTDDRQWVEMKDLEFHPVTLCSRWRPGQARPGLSQERKSERERGEEWRWGGGAEKRGEGQSCCFNFFLLAWILVCFFFFLWRTPSLLSCGIKSSSSLLLSCSPPLSSPPPTQLRLHLSPATEALTPADPPLRGGKERT